MLCYTIFTWTYLRYCGTSLSWHLGKYWLLNPAFFKAMITAFCDRALKHHFLSLKLHPRLYLPFTGWFSSFLIEVSNFRLPYKTWALILGEAMGRMMPWTSKYVLLSSWDSERGRKPHRQRKRARDHINNALWFPFLSFVVNWAARVPFTQSFFFLSLSWRLVGL